MSGAWSWPRHLARHAGACGLALLALGLFSRGTQDANANGETRTLELYHAHTRESLRVTFKRDGVFDSDALSKLNHFLRDWRNDDATSMAPQLFDIVWYVYREVGANEPIKVVSAYRSPTTNAMLARRSRAVAKNSHHMRGNAMDFHIPGVSMAKVREIGMRLQRGGVGYYPTAGSPFVHLDVGTVRSWPRMPRDQLERLFPDGKTVHLPADGVPLANYQLALAEVQARGGSALDYDTVRTTRGRSLWALLFGSGEEDDGGGAESPASRTAAARRATQRAPAVASSGPVPGSENVMVASVAPVAEAARAAPVRVQARPIEAELRPQPGAEPAQAAASAPQLALLPVPPVRPQDPASGAAAAAAASPQAVELPVPPIRPRALAQGEPAAAPAVAPAPVAEAPASPADLPLPPRRLAALAAPAEESRAEAPREVAANLPLPPQRRTLPEGAGPGLPGIMAPSGANAAETAVSAYAPANLPVPPPRVSAIAATARAAAPEPVRHPVRVKQAVDREGKADLTALIAAESARVSRPKAVVNVAPPPVETEIRREIVTLPLARTQAPAETAGAFAGRFIRPLSARFVKAGQP